MRQMYLPMKQNHWYRRHTSGCQGGGGWGRDGGGHRVSKCKLLYIEWINNKVLLYSRKLYSISYDKP